MHPRTPLIIGMSSLMLFACTVPWKNPGSDTVSGGRSALFTTDTLSMNDLSSIVIRRSALLGLYVSDYLSQAIDTEAQGAITAVTAQNIMMQAQENVRDPDYELLQALQDALEVDVADLLNRSDNREQALDTYSDAMTNVAERANERFKELSSVQEELADLVRSQNKERATAERDVKVALKEKDFTKAQELQKILLEKESEYADTTLKKSQVDDIVSMLDQLLTIYGQKILAIQKNREALIVGVKIVDVPGIDDLKLIERVRKQSAKKSGSFDSMLQGTGLQ